MKRNIMMMTMIIGLIVISITVVFNSLDKLDYDKSILYTDDTVEIRFSSSWAGTDPKADYLERVIDLFEEKHPNIRIINESAFGEDFLFKLKANFASGNGPDVFGLWPGSDLEMLIENQMIADLSRVLIEDKAWSENFDPKVFEFLDQGYQKYSIPFEIIYEGLYINTDLFKTYNVKIPTNYEELQIAIVKFKNNDIVPIAYNSTPEGSFIYQNMVAQIAGKYDAENPVRRIGTVKSGYIEAMYKMKELYDLGAFPKNAFSLDDVSRNRLFINKEAAMIVQGSWFNSSELDETVSIIPFPIGDREKTAVVYGVGNGNYHINKSTYDNPEKSQAALTFLKFLTSDESREIFDESPSYITSGKEVSDAYLKQIGLALIKEADELVGPPDHYVNRIFWEQVLIKEFPRMLEGEITPEEIFEKMKDY